MHHDCLGAGAILGCLFWTGRNLAFWILANRFCCRVFSIFQNRSFGHETTRPDYMYLVPSYDVYIPHKLASVLFSIQDARAKCKNNLSEPSFAMVLYPWFSQSSRDIFSSMSPGIEYGPPFTKRSFIHKVLWRETLKSQPESRLGRGGGSLPSKRTPFFAAEARTMNSLL